MRLRSLSKKCAIIAGLMTVIVCSFLLGYYVSHLSNHIGWIMLKEYIEFQLKASRSTRFGMSEDSLLETWRRPPDVLIKNETDTLKIYVYYFPLSYIIRDYPDLDENTITEVKIHRTPIEIVLKDFLNEIDSTIKEHSHVMDFEALFTSEEGLTALVLRGDFHIIDSSGSTGYESWSKYIKSYSDLNFSKRTVQHQRLWQ